MAQGQPTDASELFAEQKADLDEEWHDAFDALTAQGKSPSGIKATIEYVTTPKTQQEVARERSVSETTIRSLQAAVIALGPVDERRDANHSGVGSSTLDYCNYIADRFGWEEGIEYSINDSAGHSQSQHPRLLKEGWRSIYEQLVADE